MSARHHPANVMALIRAITHERALQQQFEHGDRDALYDRFAITPEQRDALSAPDWRKLGAIGVPPVAQIGFQIYTNSKLFQHLNMQAVLPRVLGGDPAQPRS